MTKRSPVHDAVALIDGRSEPTSEAHISDAIRLALPDGTLYESLSEAEQAEILAFGFNGADDNLEDPSLGTYYGPKRIVEFPDGHVESWPKVTDVTPSMISHWEQRAAEAVHPVLRARYADLLWDLTRRVADRAPSVEFARAAIDANLAVAQKRLDAFDGLVGHRLRRALALALSISDPQRVQAVVDQIVEYDAGAADRESRRPQGFAFDVLLLEHNRLKVDNGLRDRLLRAELDLFDRYVGTGHMEAVDTIVAERIAMRLVRFYRKQKEPEGVQRVLRLFGSAFVSAMGSASAIVASAQVQRLYQLFHDNGMPDDARALEAKMRELGEASIGEMQTFTMNVYIPAEEIDAVSTWIGEQDTAHAVERFWRYFLPDRDHVQRTLEQQAKDTPLQYLMSQSIVDQSGNPIAQVASVEDDPSGRLAMETANHISMATPVLIRVADRLRTNGILTLDTFLPYLSESPAFPEAAHPILAKGLGAYFSEDYIVAISVLVPQLELGIRETAKRIGASVFKPNRSGGRVYRSLDDLLRDPAVVEFFGESATHYLRVLLTDQRGWNMRNTLCHGLADARAFDAEAADRVFHVLTLLAQLRVKPQE